MMRDAAASGGAAGGAASTAAPSIAAVGSHGGSLDGVEELLRVLPVWIQEEAESRLDVLEEIAVDLGRPLTVRFGGTFARSEREVTKDDIHYVVHRVHGFREDNRTGIDRTVHRIAAIRDRYGEIVGITIRVGRFLPGVAEPLVGVLRGSSASLMVIGPPGVGKTTLLRDIARVLADDLGPAVVIVDSSNEIGGDGKIPHPGIHLARRMQVPNPSVQAQVLMQALANHGPKVIIADEIGYHSDVEVVITIARRGVRSIATVHGEVLKDVLENPDLEPLLGGIDPSRSRRLGRPIFGSALEIRGRGQLFFHEDLARSVDALLAGREPPGVWLAGGPVAAAGARGA